RAAPRGAALAGVHPPAARAAAGRPAAGPDRRAVARLRHRPRRAPEPTRRVAHPPPRCCRSRPGIGDPMNEPPGHPAHPSPWALAEPPAALPGLGAPARADLRLAAAVVVALSALGAVLGAVWSAWSGPQQRAYVIGP